MGSKLEEILAFVQVVENKSFTKAAEKLDVAKSSLSRRVNELEKRLGVQLIQRTTRKLFLTEQGEYFYDRSNIILSAIEEMENTTTDSQLKLKGRIKIAIPISFAQRNLSKLLSQFITKYPQIDLVVDLNDRQIDLIEDGFDLAIRIGQLQDSSLIAKRLGNVKFVTCASPSYIQQHGEPTEPNELKNHKGLFYSNVAENKLWCYRVKEKIIHCPPIKAIAANNGDFLAQTAVNGIGVIRSPEFIVKNYLDNKELIPMLQKYDTANEGIYAVFPPGRLIPARIRKLVAFLKQEFEKQDG